MTQRNAQKHWLDRPWLAIAVPALLSLLLSFLPFVRGQIPQPDVHDEFAHLLAADTFMHGRLTNPTPPLAQFFEAPHLLLRPTYTSKYLPGQALALAMGQLLGQPIIGAYLTAAAACGAIAWLILGCLPGRWALLGGSLAAGHPLLIWWSQTYWGGGVALLGGALLAGTTIRLARFDEYRQRWALLAGFGCSLLILSRPFEGGLTGMLLASALLVMAARRRQLRHVLRPVPIMLAMVAVTFTWLGYYNFRVTGSPLQLPYTLAAKQYMTAPLMYFQPVPTPPKYSSDFMAYFYHGYEWPEYAAQLTWHGYFVRQLQKVGELWMNIARAWALLVLPLVVGVCQVRRNSIARIMTFIFFGMPIIQFALTPWLRNQYLAPVMGGFFTLVAIGFFHLARLRVANVAIGATLTTLILVAQLLQTGLTETHLLSPRRDSLGFVRQQIMARLRSTPGPKLLFIRHRPNGTFADLVYNSANIDAQDIIFARDLGPQTNRELIAHYPQRQPWRLTLETVDLQPYFDSTTQP